MDRTEKLISVFPNELCNWEGHDRNEFELDTEHTVNSLLQNGQTTPIIIRKCYDRKKINKGIKYEIIDGERRWHASKVIAKTAPSYKLNAILRALSDEEAYIVQLVANEHSPLSGYSQALSYQKTLEICNLKRYELAEKLGIDKATFTRRMCYLEIDEKLWMRIRNKRNISTATAANIAVLLKKARKISKSLYDKTLNRLIAIAERIEAGMATKDIQLMNAELSFNNTQRMKKIRNKNGELLFTISPIGSIIISKLTLRTIDRNILELKLSEILEDMSNHISNDL